MYEEFDRVGQSGRVVPLDLADRSGTRRGSRLHRYYRGKLACVVQRWKIPEGKPTNSVYNLR